MLTLKINGTDRGTSIDWTTLTYTEVLTKEVDTLSFSVKKSGSKYVPTLGEQVELWQDSIKLFGGVVVEKDEKMLGGILIGYNITCKDWSYYLDGKLVAKNYANQTADEIFLDIISTYTSGFTVVNVKANAPLVTSIQFNYEQVTQSLIKLAQLVGWDWYVDPSMDLHFFDQETYTAPFQLDDTSGAFEWGSLEINQSVVDLRNSIFVRGGNYKKTIAEGSALDVYKANGTDGVFPLAYQYDNVQVKLDGVAQTVGIDNIDSPGSVQVLYNFNQKFVRFTTTPTSGQIVKVYGDAYIPIIAQVRDQTSIATYGEFQEVIIDKSISSVAEAQSRAASELSLYSQNTYEANFKTTQTGLKSGQMITLNSTIRDMHRQFKINRITGKARGSDHMEYSAQMISSGEITFVDIMLALIGKTGGDPVIASGEVLERLEVFPEAVGVADAVGTPTATTGPYLWGSFNWGFATWS